MQEQTWWNKHVQEQLDTFNGWIGDEDAQSRVYIVEYLKNKPYETIVDLGCGNAILYHSLKKNNVNIEYTGVDSCNFFVETNNKLNINTLFGDIRKLTGINDSTYDIGFSRHTLEHQPTFELELNEMIRISKYEACHIFFIKPDSDPEVKYEKESDLYHNKYSKKRINNFLKARKKVKSWDWIDINENECALHIILKS